MNGFTPASLPTIDAVDVVVLDRVQADRVSEYMANARSAPFATARGRDAQVLASCWRELPPLPPDEEMRCHIPAFGFRFFAGGRLLCQASVCWQCRNIRGDVDGQPFAYVFDPEHAIAQRLLAEAHRVVGTRGT